MIDHRNSDVARTWDAILDIAPEPLSTLKGERGQHTDLYERLFRKKGVYVIRDSQEQIVYIGIAGGGNKEGGLADRLWAHIAPASALNKRLKELGLSVNRCTVAIHEEADATKRRRAEMYGIAVCSPIGNLD
jgi:hypothetical protein